MPHNLTKAFTNLEAILNKATQPKPQQPKPQPVQPELKETFAIQVNTTANPSLDSNTQAVYFINEQSFTNNLSQATKFQSINTAILFNRILNGRIVTVIN